MNWHEKIWYWVDNNIFLGQKVNEQWPEGIFQGRRVIPHPSGETAVWSDEPLEPLPEGFSGPTFYGEVATVYDQYLTDPLAREGQE
jgi:hypothetical protein